MEQAKVYRCRVTQWVKEEYEVEVVHIRKPTRREILENVQDPYSVTVLRQKIGHPVADE